MGHYNFVICGGGNINNRDFKGRVDKKMILMKGSPEPPQGYVQRQEGGENEKGIMKRRILFDIFCGEKGELFIILCF